MRFRWQNLNNGDNKRFGLRGRCWLRFGRNERRCFRLEWGIPTRSFAIEYCRGPNFHIALPLLFSMYAGFSEEGGDKELSLSVHHGSLWWNLWTDKWSWSSTIPRWRNGSFNPADFFLGRHNYSEKIIETRDVLVPMPERPYRGTATIELAMWKRPRWLFTKRVMRGKIDMADGEQIPCMGKGENSWDCGEDATYGLTTPANSIEEAIGKLVASAMSRRRQYGTPDRIKKQIEAATAKEAADGAGE